MCEIGELEVVRTYGNVGLDGRQAGALQLFVFGFIFGVQWPTAFDGAAVYTGDWGDWGERAGVVVVY